MKTKLLLFGFLSCLIFGIGCRKDALTSIKSQLPGSWELRDVQGGFMPLANQPSNVSPGNGTRWIFTSSEYQFYSQGQLINSGTYALIKKDTYGGAYPETALVLDGSDNMSARISIAKDTLTIYSGTIAADGVITKYIRQ